MTALPSPFDQRQQCLAAIAEHEATKPQTNWTLQCVPAASAISEEEVPDDAAPDEPAQ